MKTTQINRILAYLDENKKITQIQALNDLGIMRLASRMSDLKQMGYPISKKMITVYNRYGEECRVAEYSLKEVG